MSSSSLPAGRLVGRHCPADRIGALLGFTEMTNRGRAMFRYPVCASRTWPTCTWPSSFRELIPSLVKTL
jgi:hypothetical protein